MPVPLCLELSSCLCLEGRSVGREGRLSSHGRSMKSCCLEAWWFWHNVGHAKWRTPRLAICIWMHWIYGLYMIWSLNQSSCGNNMWCHGSLSGRYKLTHLPRLFRNRFLVHRIVKIHCILVDLLGLSFQLQTCDFCTWLGRPRWLKNKWQQGTEGNRFGRSSSLNIDIIISWSGIRKSLTSTAHS